MPLLFSYGSLQHESVQLETFGRRLLGIADWLPGHALTRVPISDPIRAAIHRAAYYANVEPVNDPNSQVPGTVLEVTEDELSMADEYERSDGYARIRVTMVSRSSAWVYVFKWSPAAQGAGET